MVTMFSSLVQTWAILYAVTQNIYLSSFEPPDSSPDIEGTRGEAHLDSSGSGGVSSTASAPSPSTSSSGLCGNGVCDPVESCWSCSADCGPCQKLSVSSECMNPLHYHLTFDDGPSGNTEELLDILAYYGVPATFFVIGGSVDQRPAVVRRELQEGHLVASHTYLHRDLTLLSDDEIVWEMAETERALMDATGCLQPKFMRPPYGSYDGRVMSVLETLGFSILHWNLDTNDWRYAVSNPDQVLWDVRAQLDQQAPGPILHLQHDLLRESVEIVPSIIEEVRARGYRLVDLPTCLFGDRDALHDEPSMRFSYEECVQSKLLSWD